MCGHHVVITFNIPTVSSLHAKLTWFWLGFYQYRRDVSALTISSSDSPQEMEKVCFPRCQTIPSMCTCVPVFVYLPKSLVHTAIRTSSSEQGLQVTKTENVKTLNTFTKEKNNTFFFFFSMIHFHWSVAFVSSCDFCHAYSASCSLFRCLWDQRETSREHVSENSRWGGRRNHRITPWPRQL